MEWHYSRAQLTARLHNASTLRYHRASLDSLSNLHQWLAVAVEQSTPPETKLRVLYCTVLYYTATSLPKKPVPVSFRSLQPANSSIHRGRVSSTGGSPSHDSHQQTAVRPVPRCNSSALICGGLSMILRSPATAVLEPI